MVEFAVVLPILALLLFAILQFGITLNNYVTLTDAVRAGARQAAVSRCIPSCASPNPSPTVISKVRAAAVNLNQTNFNVNCGTTSQTSLCVTVTPNPSWTGGADVTVTATYPYKISLLGLVVKSGRLTSTTVERVE
jgi:Flp pilus assembly protein TadG